MNYIQTPFTGHKAFTFIKRGLIKHGKGYYKMNTTILNDTKYQEIIQELAGDIRNNDSSDPIHNWQTFTLLVKSRSITYSKIKNKIKRKLKDRIKGEMSHLEEESSLLQQDEMYYDYLQRKLHHFEIF